MDEDPRSEDLLKPILRGRDIRPYRAQWAGLWLIATFPSVGVDINDYPAIKRHLLSYGKARLEQSGKVLAGGLRARKRSPHHWYQLQDTCSYHEEFENDKLCWMHMSPVARFSYVEGGIYCNQKGFIMSGEEIKYLCAVLNSQVVSNYVKSVAVTTGLGLIQWDKFVVEDIPVPPPTESSKAKIEDLAGRAIASPVVEERIAITREVEEYVRSSYKLDVQERLLLDRRSRG